MLLANVLDLFEDKQVNIRPAAHSVCLLKLKRAQYVQFYLSPPPKGLLLTTCNYRQQHHDRDLDIIYLFSR